MHLFLFESGCERMKPSKLSPTTSLRLQNGCLVGREDIMNSAVNDLPPLVILPPQSRQNSNSSRDNFAKTFLWLLRRRQVFQTLNSGFGAFPCNVVTEQYKVPLLRMYETFKVIVNNFLTSSKRMPGWP